MKIFQLASEEINVHLVLWHLKFFVWQKFARPSEFDSIAGWIWFTFNVHTKVDCTHNSIAEFFMDDFLQCGTIHAQCLFKNGNFRIQININEMMIRTFRDLFVCQSFPSIQFCPTSCKRYNKGSDGIEPFNGFLYGIVCSQRQSWALNSKNVATVCACPSVICICPKHAATVLNQNNNYIKSEYN